MRPSPAPATADKLSGTRTNVSGWECRRVQARSGILWGVFWCHELVSIPSKWLCDKDLPSSIADVKSIHDAQGDSHGKGNSDCVVIQS